MMKLYYLFLMVLSTSSFGKVNFDVEKRVTEAFIKRSTNDLLIGTSVGFIDQQGQVEINLGMVASSHERFEIGSISKSFTGIVLAQLVLEQKVNLTTLLEEIVPELKGTYAGSVSLQLLANHKARFVRDQPDGDEVSEADLINFLKSITPRPDGPAAGEKLYSNLGFSTLGIVISRITGKSFSDSVRERIFVPLQMNESSFLTTSDEHLTLITPHNILLQPTLPDILWDLPGASGGIISSLSDMMKFLELNLNPDEAVKLAQKECLGFDNNPGEGYIWKNGGMTGFSTIMIIDSVNHRASVVLSNSSNSSSVQRLGLIALGEEDTYQPDLKITPEFSSSVVGKYSTLDSKYFMEVVTTPKGFLGFVLRTPTLTANSWATRLLSDGTSKFLFLGRGWSSKDDVEFKINTDTGKKEVLMREFEKLDGNGNPVYIETIFISTES